MIVSNNLSNTLISPTNFASVPQILKSVLDGCREYRDISISKICYTILKKLVEQWAGVNGVQGFDKFVYEEIVPMLIKEPFRPEFNLTDAEANLVIQENVSIQKSIMSQCGKEFFEYLRIVLLPSLQCPSELAQQYAIALESASIKDFKTYFTTFVSSHKNGKT